MSFSCRHANASANAKGSAQYGKLAVINLLKSIFPSHDSLCTCAGCHMTAAVASVPTLGLPYAVSLLGWAGGLIALVAGGLVTLFTSLLIAGLLEFGGKRHIRYRDLSQAIFGAPLLADCFARLPSAAITMPVI